MENEKNEKIFFDKEGKVVDHFVKSENEDFDFDEEGLLNNESDYIKTHVFSENEYYNMHPKDLFSVIKKLNSSIDEKKKDILELEKTISFDKEKILSIDKIMNYKNIEELFKEYEYSSLRFYKFKNDFLNFLKNDEKFSNYEIKEVFFIFCKMFSKLIPGLDENQLYQYIIKYKINEEDY